MLIIDGEKPELPEITDTYSDTWGKMVKVLTARKYVCKNESILVVHPEFENIEFSYEETPLEAEKKSTIYSEELHLEGVNDNVKEVYNHLKTSIQRFDSSFLFNPQKYYISIKGAKNIVFLKIRRKKIRMVMMLPEDDIRSCIKSHSVKTLSEPVQKFYNGPCAAVDVYNLKNIEEIIELVKSLMKENPGNELPEGTSAP